MAPPSRSPHSKAGSQRERQKPIRWHPWIEPISQIWTTSRRGFVLAGLGFSTILQDPPLRRIMQVMEDYIGKLEELSDYPRSFCRKGKNPKGKYSYGK